MHFAPLHVRASLARARLAWVASPARIASSARPHDRSCRGCNTTRHGARACMTKWLCGPRGAPSTEAPSKEATTGSKFGKFRPGPESGSLTGPAPPKRGQRDPTPRTCEPSERPRFAGAVPVLELHLLHRLLDLADDHVAELLALAGAEALHRRHHSGHH